MLLIRLKCIEAPEEQSVKDTETFSKLDCHISICKGGHCSSISFDLLLFFCWLTLYALPATNFMQNGIQDVSSLTHFSVILRLDQLSVDSI
jgi:hypothetical protein